MAEQEQHPTGRPRLTFDLRLVEDLGKIQSTHSELAAVLGCHLETVRDRLHNDPEFSAAYEKGLENGDVCVPLLHHVLQHHHPRFQRCLSAAVGRGSCLFQGQPACSASPSGADNQGSDDETTAAGKISISAPLLNAKAAPKGAGLWLQMVAEQDSPRNSGNHSGRLHGRLTGT